MRNIDKGRVGESLAESYLIKKGYKFVERNYKTIGSEIDLIFIAPKKVLVQELDEDISNEKIKKELRSNIIKTLKNTLVFVEVKYRTTSTFGKPFEAVNLFKQKHMQRGANQFVLDYQIKNPNIRFDIISIENEIVSHIKDVF